MTERQEDEGERSPYMKIELERKRTGIGAKELSKYISLPPGMNLDRFRNIIDGKIQNIRDSEWDFILKAYALFPNSERATLTVRKVNRIRRVIDSKKISKADISKSFPRYEGFNVGTLNSWLNGSVTSAKKSHYERVKSFVEDYQVESKFNIYECNDSYVEIDDELRDFVRSEIERTGIGPQRVLKGNREARDAGLTSGIIYGVSGKNGLKKNIKASHRKLLKELWCEK